MIFSKRVYRNFYRPANVMVKCKRHNDFFTSVSIEISMDLPVLWENLIDILFFFQTCL